MISINGITFSLSDPRAVAAMIAAGLILDTVTRGRREVKLLAYLEQRAPGDWDRRERS